MNADAWQAYTQALQLLGLLGPKADPRKLRLFLVACARRVLPPEPDDELLNALVVAERFAEGLASRAELGRASLALKKHHAARAARWPTLYSEHIRSLPAWHATREAISSAATEGVTVCAWSSTRTPSGSMTLPTREWRAQCELLREVLKFQHPADVLVSNFFKAQRALGPRERHALAETTYDVIRRLPCYRHLAQSGSGALERRMAVLGWQGGAGVLRAALTPNEQAWQEKVDAVDRSALPEPLRHNLPEWIPERHDHRRAGRPARHVGLLAD